MDNHLYSLDRLVMGQTVRIIERLPTDVTALPTPGVSLITEADWLAMCEQSGGEDRLLAEMGASYAEG